MYIIKNNEILVTHVYIQTSNNIHIIHQYINNTYTTSYILKFTHMQSI